jgi:outer membrane protein assembly factor BamB
MKIHTSVNIGLLIGTIILLISSIVTPMTIGYNVWKPDKVTVTENYECCYIHEISDFIQYQISKELNTYDNNESEKISKTEEIIQQIDGPPMDSPWPMYCHDVRHTGRSPYSIIDNPGLEKWRFNTIENALGSPVIDGDGVIYIGSHDFYAVYPNGTLKWKYDTPHTIESAAAIDENGIIYVGNAIGDYNLYAFYPNGTLKWKYKTVNDVSGSPVIGNDGTIYFGTEGSSYPNYSGYIIALYPNGTLKWRYKTSHFVHSDPVIGDNETIYCGSHDGYLYALYPNNGSLKWKFKTGDWVGRGPCIADDGTIYFGSWDGYLYAVYPNGTLKWKLGGYLAGTTPVIADDGTIYVGNRYLTAVYPNNGSIKWSFDPGPERTIRGGNPCISADGTILFGTHIDETDGGELITVNLDGTERWRIMLATDYIWSAPAIGSDGTIYVGSCNDGYHPGSWGYLHAIGELDPNAPSAPEIDGPKKIKSDVEYEYKFKATSPLSNNVYYWIEWGDNKGTGWIGPYTSGEQISVSHKWPMEGIFTIKARAKDTDNLWGPWGEFEIEVTTSAPNKPTINGPTNGKVGVTYTYWAVTTDPENDKLSYFFDWGDGTTSGWTTPYVPSGTNVSASHKWKLGIFNIKVKAKDENGYESGWSDALSLTIPRNKILHNSLFLRLLERFPMLGRLLNPLIK